MKHLRSGDTGTDFQLGLFSANSPGGLAMTKAPERWSGSWDDNRSLAVMADEAGIDFLLPIARFIGYGGETDFHGEILDPLSWQAGLLAATERIGVFATVHTAFNHPVITAKALATNSQIGHGRAGINIVAGWNQPEYEVFGVDLPSEHDARYALAQEWWDIVRTVLTAEEPFDWNGEHYSLKHVIGKPKSFGGLPPVLNAGSSTQGREFAARNADYVFTVVGAPEDGAPIVQSVTADARARGRDTGAITLTHVVCRPTDAEAEEFLHYYADEQADWEGIDNAMRLQGLHAKTFTPEMLGSFRSRFAAGYGSAPLVGSPDTIAALIQRYADAGFAGITLSFMNYLDELPFFVEEVLPRLERRGIRGERR
jgi:alkanesulfonate monooxygenase SsuD/methylene tetrahydromethanopterin reductase-like flavin-dependent oxidoreductase (luciferase family)